jgi:hypothetical protein
MGLDEYPLANSPPAPASELFGKRANFLAKDGLLRLRGAVWLFNALIFLCKPSSNLLASSSEKPSQTIFLFLHQYHFLNNDFALQWKS